MDEMCSISRGMGKIMLEVLPFCLIWPLICARGDPKHQAQG